MVKGEINYINLICDFAKIRKGSKEEIQNILCRYNIARPELLQNKILDYIFSINNDEIRTKFIDMISEDDVLPIIHECYLLIENRFSKDEYIRYKVKNVESTVEKLGYNYELCIKIISQCTFLRKMAQDFFKFKEYKFGNSMSVSRRDINYVNLICEVEKSGKAKEPLSGILYRYGIPKVESLQRRVLDYIFSITDDNFRFKLINILAESNNLPIINECYYIIYSSLSKEDYSTNHIKNVGGSRKTSNLKYDLCIRIISQSSFLQRKQKTVDEGRERLSENNIVGGIKVFNHKYRNRAAMRYQ